MSPRPADPAVRAALIDAGARLLAEEGKAALTTRRLVSSIGASTSAVYTYFGSMAALRREIRLEGIRRLGAALDGVRHTADPVADLASLGGAYGRFALDNADLYRAAFLETADALDQAAADLTTFDVIVDAVTRCVAAGRFRRQERPVLMARQLWTAGHGAVAAVLAGLFTVGDMVDIVSPLAATLFVGFGDEPAAATRSLRRARATMEPSRRRD